MEPKRDSEQDTESPSRDGEFFVGSEVSVAPLWSKNDHVAGNSFRQLLASERNATASKVNAAVAELVDHAGTLVEVHRKVEPGFGTGPVLVAQIGVQHLSKANSQQFSWSRRPVAQHPQTVVDNLQGRFQLVLETDERQGFRIPQAGAIQSVLGYWTTESLADATVVMPTGTGKTDTMVALFASSLPERVLVLVPSDALRTQIAQTFEKLGVLPLVGALGEQPVIFPVVGRLTTGLQTAADARQFARRCNVVVATPQALDAGHDEARLAFMNEFDVLFIDEAHHVRAATWTTVRTQFAEKRVVQFTATPYREDGQDLGGKLVYVFPLGLAQRQGYFSRINYRAVRSLGAQDRVIAETALEQLRQDRAQNLDHVVMARVNRKGRADDIVELYQELGPEFSPVVLYSGLQPASAKRAALEALENRTSRVIVCVDMLGEGFDLPALKIAAMHDPHKSLGITLQFVGRFARVKGGVGDATVVVGRPDSLHDENLRALYSEDADWNGLIRDLSQQATAAEEEASDFDEGFSDSPVGVAAHDICPKMSTVVFRTRCASWDPQAVVDLMGAKRLLTNPIVHNRRANVAWFVKRSEGPTSWGPDPGYVDVLHELFVLYWDRMRGLLYVNSSNNASSDSHHERLAQAVTGESATLIRGEDIFRVYGGVQRLVATNLGVLDVRNRARRFAMYSGPDVTEGFPGAEKETKTQTNIFANGHQHGERIHIGASLKGRVWAWRPAGSLLEWVHWCDDVGSKLTNTSIDIDEVFSNFIRPELLTDRPALVVLAAEWSADVYTSLTGDLRVSHKGDEYALIDSEIRVLEHSTSGPIKLEIATPEWAVRYDLEITDAGMSVSPSGSDTVRVVTTSRTVPLTDFIRRRGLTLLLEQDAVIEPPGVLLRPTRELPAFPVGSLRTHVSWECQPILAPV